MNVHVDVDVDVDGGRDELQENNAREGEVEGGR